MHQYVWYTWESAPHGWTMNGLWGSLPLGHRLLHQRPQRAIDHNVDLYTSSEYKLYGLKPLQGAYKRLYQKMREEGIFYWNKVQRNCFQINFDLFPMYRTSRIWSNFYRNIWADQKRPVMSHHCCTTPGLHFNIWSKDHFDAISVTGFTSFLLQSLTVI